MAQYTATQTAEVPAAPQGLSSQFAIVAPGGTNVYVNGWTNAAFFQSVTVTFPGSSVGPLSLSGQGDNNKPMTPANASVQVPSAGILQVQVNISPAIAIQNSGANFGNFVGSQLVFSEDRENGDDHNDSVVLFMWYPGQ